MEELIWAVLDHPNVLPLNDVIDLKSLDLKLYIMPIHPTSLNRMLESSEFLADPGGLNRIRKWLQNTAKGLQYLHDKGFVHLDIKSDNVLISAEDTAIICDFSGISLKKMPCTRLIAPCMYRPPESFNASERIDGAMFDVWTYALMSLYALIRNWPKHYLGDVFDYHSWQTNVESALKVSLKPETFNRNLRLSVPAVAMTDEDICITHNFILTMLQWDPKCRPTACQILEHSFLSITDIQNKILLSEDCNKFEIKTTNTLEEERLDEAEEKSVNLVSSIKYAKKDSTPKVSEKSQVFESKEPVLTLFSAEKHEEDIAPVQQSCTKDKKNIGRKMKGWITKKWSQAKNGARKKYERFIENVTEKHWTEHWTLIPLYC